MRSAPRPLDLARDRAALLQLWEVTLGATWPVHADALIAATPLGYVFETPDQLVGAIAFDESGAISYVIVDPSWRRQGIGDEDRKSTRLNSSHRTISYAVFCLKKKKSTHDG